jgi:type I restriction enzyme S subunit
MSFPRYPKYKASGVEWLLEVPEGWSVKRLRFATNLNPSKSEIADLDRGTAVSFLPMEAIGDDGTLTLDKEKTIAELETGYTYFRDGDVTIAKITPCYENGKGALMRGLTNGIGFGTTELIVARPLASQITSNYLHYLFISPDFRSIGESHMYGAGGQKRVPDAYVRNFATGIPPLPEQTAIAEFLDRETGKIDGLVAEQRRLMELLKEKRQAVISHAVTKGLSPEAPMKSSGIEWLGDVPVGWMVATVRRVVARVEQGWSPNCLGDPAEANEWGVVKSGCVNRGTFDERENKALPDSLEPIPEYEIQVGDVLTSRASGSPELVGSTAYVSVTRSKLMLSDKIFRIQMTPKMDGKYYVALFNSRIMRFQIERAISGADGLANNLPQSAMKAFFCPVPPPDEQKAIVEFLEGELAKFDTLTAEAQRTIDLLQERRTALISAAVTGQIDVRKYSKTRATA